MRALGGGGRPFSQSHPGASSWRGSPSGPAAGHRRPRGTRRPAAAPRAHRRHRGAAQRLRPAGGAPGGDASGGAGVLEMARLLADTPLPATVWFVGFTMEEDGLVGSGQMARREAGRGRPIVGMGSLEMIPYRGPVQGKDFIAVIGSEA